MESQVMSERLAMTVTAPELPIAEALARLQDAGTGMLLIAAADRKLIGVLTDGDVRRHILAGGGLDQPCGTIAWPDPIVATEGLSPQEVLALLDGGREFPVHHVPVLGPGRAIKGLWLRSDFVNAALAPLSAVIMAGGYGARLRPLTDSMPKPMLLVGDKPLLERTVERLRQAGIHDVRVTTHYLGDRIASHFGDGHAFGVDITYLSEERPLGTAGVLARLRDHPGPLLVINGDILTNVDFRAMLAFHREHGAEATVAVRKFELQVPYGVVECAGPRVRRLREKPTEHFLVNAGLYLLEPSVLSCIPPEERFDMTDLITRLLEEQRTVVSFPVVEYWLDIGRPADFERAQVDAEVTKV